MRRATLTDYAVASFCLALWCAFWYALGSGGKP